MFTFDKITEVNGFDTDCQKNAIQNSYAAAITELESYIYVGTVKNALTIFEYSKDCNLNIPPWIIKGSDNNGEIWRYKKDGSCPWEMVYKSDYKNNIRGFSSIITHKSNDAKTIYAAAISTHIYLLKSTDGINWVRVNTSNIQGTSVKCLYSFDGRLYISTIKVGFNKNAPYLYESTNSECTKFKPVIDTEDIYFDYSKNPVGRIENVNSFNNKLYVGISTPGGCELWRSTNNCPSTNTWIKVGSKGFFDRANINIISSEVFKDYLYVSCTKCLPLALLAPLGFDLIRVDKNDTVELVVGGEPIIKQDKYNNKIDYNSLSGFNSGFNSFFNVYGWQLQSYCNTLFVTTYDASTNMTLIRDSIIYNSEAYIESIGYENYNTLLKCYTDICNLITFYSYPKGANIYISTNGTNFKPIVLNGLSNTNNYGMKSLYKGSNGLLYLGTADPYNGCEVWEINKDNYIADCKDDEIIIYYKNLEKINKKLREIYPVLIKLLNSYQCL